MTYDQATRIWLRWHRYVCQPLQFRNYPMFGKNRGSVKLRTNRVLGWCYKQQLNFVCGPLDNWSHSRPEEG